jgi:integrase
MSFSVNITKRDRKRRLKSGETVVQTRWVLNYREPRTGKRVQLFFARQKEAQAKRNQLIAHLANGTHADDRLSLTVDAIVRRWLENREGEVKRQTLKGYRETAGYIIDPLLIGTSLQRWEFARTGLKSEETRLVSTLGELRIKDLTTSDIRVWHKTISNEVGSYTANRAKMFLRAALALAAEDFNIRPPAMPTTGRAKPKAKKAILTSEQISLLLQHARADRERGIYVAFPFLAGTRPSEQLGLLWEDVDFEANMIHIRRMQERDGTISNLTKTIAGTRDLPMCSLLRAMLLEWRLICPRLKGELHRVFPGLGHPQPWPLPRIGGGGPLLYWNFRTRMWVPMLKKLGLPAVTPHSARHCFISTLQAQGIEVGLVASLAGHKNPNVTLGHYTHAVRGGEGAVAALERAFIGDSSFLS